MQNNYISKAPCFNCEIREIGCHAACKKYIYYREGREKIYKNNKTSVDVQGYFQVELEKNIFGRGRRTKRHENY